MSVMEEHVCHQKVGWVVNDVHGKGKVCTGSGGQMAHQAYLAYLGFRTMKRLAVFCTPPWMGR